MAPVQLPLTLLGLEYPKGELIGEALPAEMFLDIVELMRDYPHWLTFGMTGSGKGLLGASIIREFWENGGKVVVIRCGAELEQMWMHYPITGHFKKLIERMGDAPHSYPVRGYVPVCEGDLPENLPDMFELYTIPLKSKTVSAELLSTISMVGLTEIGIDAVNGMIGELPKKANLVDLYLGIEDLIAGGFEARGLSFKIMKEVTQPSIHRIMYNLVKRLIMTESTHPLAMTNKKIKKILNNQKEITVFTQAFVPPNLKPFFALFPLKLVYDNAFGCKYPILVVATEVQEIMYDQEDRKLRTPATDLFNQMVTDIVKSGRKFGIHMLLDTQKIGDIAPKILSQCKKNSCQFEIDSTKDYNLLQRKKGDMEMSELNSILINLRHHANTGLFEYYNFSMERVFRIPLPVTEHPYEGNNSDFIGYVEQHDPDREWFEIAPVLKELDALIVDAARDKAAYLKPKKDKAAEELKRRMDDGEDEFDLSTLRRDAELLKRGL